MQLGRWREWNAEATDYQNAAKARSSSDSSKRLRVSSSTTHRAEILQREKNLYFESQIFTKTNAERGPRGLLEWGPPIRGGAFGIG